MAEHPLVTAVRATSQHEPDVVRAAAVGAQIDGILASAVALTAPTLYTRLVLAQAARQLDDLARPFLANAPIAVLVAWYDSQRRALHRHALALFDMKTAMTIAPDVPHQPLLIPAPGPGPRSPFGR
jgi:hypothetical protein